MKTLIRTIVAGLVFSLLGIQDLVLALPNFNAPLNGLDGPVLAPGAPRLAPEPQPTPPTILQKTTNSITLGWVDRFSNETRNILERRQPGGPWVFLAELGPVVAVGSYTDPPTMDRDCTIPKSGCLTHSTQYCYRVHVYGAFGSKYSPETCDSTNRMRLDGVPVVDDAPGLLGELHAKWDGKKLIYVEDDANIDLTNYSEMPLRTGVTLASGRNGLKPGARLFTQGLPDNKPLFLVEGNNVRVTGLRFEGPSASTNSDLPLAYAIKVAIKNEHGLIQGLEVEIKGNEFYHWTGAGVRVNGEPRWDDEDKNFCPRQYAPPPDQWDSKGRPPRLIDKDTAYRVRITRNYFHHNQREGGGYGVVVYYSSYAYIDKNTFDANRHAIASDGRPENGYMAYHNLVLKGGEKYDGAWEHHFDMHGTCNCYKWYRVDSEHNCGPAGEYVDATQNTFWGGDQGYALYKERKALDIRGTPSIGVFFRNNVLSHHNEEEAVHENSDRDNIWVYNNTYDFQLPSFEVVVGEFDGDGVADHFIATGAGWYYSSGGRMEWRFLNAMTERIKDLVLRDFDGDGKTDVLTRRGNEWLVSCGGVGSWIKADGLACKRVESNFPNTFFDPTR